MFAIKSTGDFHLLYPVFNGRIAFSMLLIFQFDTQLGRRHQWTWPPASTRMGCALNPERLRTDNKATLTGLRALAGGQVHWCFWPNWVSNWKINSVLKAILPLNTGYNKWKSLVLFISNIFIEDSKTSICHWCCNCLLLTFCQSSATRSRFYATGIIHVTSLKIICNKNIKLGLHVYRLLRLYTPIFGNFHEQSRWGLKNLICGPAYRSK